MAGLIFILVIAGVLIGIFILFLKSMRGPLIENIDEQGLTTKSRKIYSWADLQRIEFYLLQHRVAKTKKVHSVHFYFKDGKASAGHLMKNLDALVQKAEQLQVPKSEKIIGIYVR